jgi:hypothetical protein
MSIPNFKFVAPGLRVAYQEELADKQPFKNAKVSDFPNFREPTKWELPNIKYKFNHYPFLLLRADKQIAGGRLPFQGESKLSGDPWELARQFETGLYIFPCSYMERPDECRPLLPFFLTRRNWIEVLSSLKTYHSHDDLYQSRHVPVVPEPATPAGGCQWSLRLKHLFNNWTSMIENDHWQVDADGVVGGIEKFKEADLPEKYSLYLVDYSW